MAAHPETLASVFGRLTQDTPIDASLIHRIHEYQLAFVSRSSDHLEFFGGVLMGVHPLRFRSVDRDEWFSEVLRIDELELHDALGTVAAINKDWKRASDSMNQTCIWLLHAIYQSKTLTSEQKHQGMVDTLLVLQYKFLASLMAYYYRYPADRETMEAAYASLNYRYALKTAGSWIALLRQRAEEIISPKGIHTLAQTYQRYNNDKAVVNMVNDIQGRLRKIVKSLTKVFYDIRAKGGRIGVSKDIREINGLSVVQDKQRDVSSYIRYMHAVLDDPKSFIRPELIELITDAQHTLRQGPPDQLREALEWMCINHRVHLPRWSPKVEGGYVEHFVDELLLHAFSTLQHKNTLVTIRQGMGAILERLRALYMASLMSDPSLLKCKEMASHIVAASISSRNASVAASVRTAVEIYVVARAFSMDHYNKQ